MPIISLIEQNEDKRCLVECDPSECTCGLRFVDSMPKIKRSKPVDFLTAMNRMLAWMKKNRPGKISFAEIRIRTYANGGYIHLLGEDSETFDFTHWVYPPIKSAKELLKVIAKNKKK